MFFVEEDCLPDNNVGIGEIDGQVSFLGTGHTGDDDIILISDQAGNNTIPGSVDRCVFNFHGFCKGFGHVNVKSNVFPLGVGHLKGKVS